MELVKFALFVLAIVAPGAVYSCDPQKLATECISRIGDLSSLAGEAQNNQESLKRMCDMMSSVQTCVQKYTKGCAPEVQNQLQASMASLEAFNQMCDPNNPCSLQKLQDCFKGLPMDQPGSSKNIDYKEVCGKLPMATKCVESVKGKCKDPNMAQSMESATAFFPMVDTECKKMYGEDYAATMNQSSAKEKGGENGAEKMTLLSLPLVLLSLLAVKLGL